MEYEQKVKIDPSRVEKVFTASQIMEAFSKAVETASKEFSKSSEGRKLDSGAMFTLNLTLLLHSGLVKIYLEKTLGIDGPNGGYET